MKKEEFERWLFNNGFYNKYSNVFEYEVFFSDHEVYEVSVNENDCSISKSENQDFGCNDIQNIGVNLGQYNFDKAKQFLELLIEANK